MTRARRAHLPRQARLLMMRVAVRPDAGQGPCMNEAFGLAEEPHRRLNILTGEWVLVSPHRMQRPWQGQVEPVVDAERPALRPGVLSLSGQRARGRKAQPGVPRRLVVRERFCGAPPEPGLRAIGVGIADDSGLLVARPESGHLSRRLLLAAPRSVAPRPFARRTRRRRRAVD